MNSPLHMEGAINSPLRKTFGVEFLTEQAVAPAFAMEMKNRKENFWELIPIISKSVRYRSVWTGWEFGGVRLKVGPVPAPLKAGSRIRRGFRELSLLTGFGLVRFCVDLWENASS